MKVDGEAYQRGHRDGLAGRVPDLPVDRPATEETAAYALGWRVGAKERRQASSSDALRLPPWRRKDVAL